MSSPLSPICTGLLALTCIAGAASSSGDPPADLHLTSSSSPSRVRIGSGVTLRYGVTNGGPATATDVGLKVPLGEAWRPVSARTSSGGCAGERSIFCHLGDIPAGKGAVITVVARPEATGNIHPRGGLTSSTPDPNPEDDFTSTQVSVFDPFAGILPHDSTAKVTDNVFHLHYGCPRRVPGYCRGDVDIVRAAPTSSPPPPGPPKTVGQVLAAARISLPPGVGGPIRIRLNGAAVKILKKTPRLPVVAITATRDGARTRVTRYRRLELIGPKPKKKKK